MMALCYVLSVAREFYFVPGKVENWIIILDASGLGLLSFPFKVKSECLIKIFIEYRLSRK